MNKKTILEAIGHAIGSDKQGSLEQILTNDRYHHIQIRSISDENGEIELSPKQLNFISGAIRNFKNQKSVWKMLGGKIDFDDSPAENFDKLDAMWHSFLTKEMQAIKFGQDDSINRLIQAIHKGTAKYTI